MKFGITLIIIAVVLLTDGGMRLALSGWPGLSGVVVAVPFLYYGIKRMKQASKT